MLTREPLRNQLGLLNHKGFGMTQGKKASSASFQHRLPDAPGEAAILSVLPVGAGFSKKAKVVGWPMRAYLGELGLKASAGNAKVCIFDGSKLEEDSATAVECGAIGLTNAFQSNSAVSFLLSWPCDFVRSFEFGGVCSSLDVTMRGGAYVATDVDVCEGVSFGR
ncbi:hypothetical protein Tco_0457580 [Tanacetum coccineum]